MESIPKSQFFPVPQVNGGILVIEPKNKLPINISELEQLIRSTHEEPPRFIVG
jgi:16S rRNA A1518/A1519 N6-dimethyltransferase RsmA/KsgA/DIM1 with predicted DNA glycosylase/AP lyase activity